LNLNHEGARHERLNDLPNPISYEGTNDEKQREGETAARALWAYCQTFAGVAAICVVMQNTVLTASADSSSQSPTALTESGVVIGSMMNGVNEFLGIPYAIPPVGDRGRTPPISYGQFQGSTL
jgi:hypothetical protein